nr:PREDICTED: ADP-ribose pyrophosphatase, mitochondrial [Bemisia tabaci]XP_018902594.1 PREDICTED: ADP-ribose pyrophosphatase, mitochondrial [Bemisia tabaci]XP_018902595.1 PREDICTED: ADP-ribose pyrophosphatase, mitochondrial [Bemisia tabaci]
MKAHFKCRNGLYPGSAVQRAVVPDEKVCWSVEWPEYKPVPYTSPKATNQPWADPDLSEPSFKPTWNQLDGDVNRKSFTGEYAIAEKAPLNPVGRTGIVGRGLLGRWGPNHAADPIVTKWKRDASGIVATSGGKKILQVVLIQRRDCGEWAIPGGMVDPGENVSRTLKREFMEEALDSLTKSDEEKSKLEKQLNSFFAGGDVLYRGYVDDPRNTDNSWMETVAMNFHDETGEIIDAVPLTAGDDAVGVTWRDLCSSQPLYASHSSLLETVAKKFDAFW